MEDKIIEAKLIEQEHRFIPIWKNFWVNKREWPPEDPRRKAANIAFAMFWIPKPSAVIVSGGLIAIFTIYFMAMQTDLLKEQNQLTAKQNALLLEQLKSQDEIYYATRKTELMSSIYSTSGRVDGVALHTLAKPKLSARIRAEAVVEYIKIRSREIERDTKELKESGRLPQAATLAFGVDLRWAPLQNVSLSNVELKHMSLFHSNLESSSLTYVNLSKSQLEYVNFSKSTLLGVNLKGASLIGANFSEADLSQLEWDDETKVLNSNIFGIRNAPKGFKEWALKRGAVEYSNNEDWIKKCISTYPALKKYMSSDEKLL